mgnify:CR=1 FL=1
MKLIFFFSLFSIALIGCRELTQDDKHLRSADDFDYEKMKVFLLDELESNYNDANLYFRLGINYKNQNLLPDAITNIEKSITIDPEKVEYYKALIPLLIKEKDWENAELYSDELKKLSPSFYHAYYYLVESCVHLNKMDKAGENLRILSQINAGYPNLSYLKGRYYLAKKDTLDAIYTFEQSIKKGQRVNELVFMLVDMYLEKGQAKEAQQLLTKNASNKQIDQVKLNISQAKLAEKNKNKVLAKLHYRKVFDYGTDCPTAYKLVDHYLTKWNLDSAQYFFNKTSTCQKEDRDYYFYNGWLNYRRRNYEDALKSYKIAKDLDPDDKTVRWHYKRAYEKLYPPTPVLVDSNRNTNNNTLPIE